MMPSSVGFRAESAASCSHVHTAMTSICRYRADLATGAISHRCAAPCCTASRFFVGERSFERGLEHDSESLPALEGLKHIKRRPSQGRGADAELREAPPAEHRAETVRPAVSAGSRPSAAALPRDECQRERVAGLFDRAYFLHSRSPRSRPCTTSSWNGWMRKNRAPASPCREERMESGACHRPDARTAEIRAQMSRRSPKSRPRSMWRCCTTALRYGAAPVLRRHAARVRHPCSAGWISSCRAVSGSASRACSPSRKKPGSGIRAEFSHSPRPVAAVKPWRSGRSRASLNGKTGNSLAFRKPGVRS